MKNGGHISGPRALLVLLIIYSIPAVYAGWQSIPNNNKALFDNQIAILTVSIAIIGAAVAIAALFWNAYSARQQQEKQFSQSQRLQEEQFNQSRLAQTKQHTMNLLIESRFAPFLLELNTDRKAGFPEYKDILYTDWASAMAAPRNDEPLQTERVVARRKAARALTELLNYYEFLASGIRLGDLDEELLKENVRGFFCNLVDDARFVIIGLRKKQNSDLTYKNLIWLYERWRRDNATDINGNPNERPLPLPNEVNVGR